MSVNAIYKFDAEQKLSSEMQRCTESKILISYFVPASNEVCEVWILESYSISSFELLILLRVWLLIQKY